MATSILHNRNRHKQLAPKLRKTILACEQTSFDCAVNNLTSCEEYLNEDYAYPAAIIGTLSALACMISQSKKPKELGNSVMAVLRIEIDAWMDKIQGAQDARS